MIESVAPFCPANAFAGLIWKTDFPLGLPILARRFM
jgi:hypothetical protein